MEQSQQHELLTVLKNRFLEHTRRHIGMNWETVEKRLLKHPESLGVLSKMEQTGGEPDVIAYGAETETVVYCDCVAESPVGRRSLCYDQQALVSRKKNPPEGSAMGMATAMGITLLTEEEYRALQKIEAFDIKTSSWILTPKEIRSLDGALFCDRRYGQVFVYHNGVESYYSSRGFRGRIEI